MEGEITLNISPQTDLTHSSFSIGVEQALNMEKSHSQAHSTSVMVHKEENAIYLILWKHVIASENTELKPPAFLSRTVVHKSYSLHSNEEQHNYK